MQFDCAHIGMLNMALLQQASTLHVGSASNAHTWAQRHRGIASVRNGIQQMQPLLPPLVAPFFLMLLHSVT